MIAAIPIQKGGNTMRPNGSSAPRFEHARITHLTTNHNNGAIRLVLGYYRHTSHIHRHAVACEP